VGRSAFWGASCSWRFARWGQYCFMPWVFGVWWQWGHSLFGYQFLFIAHLCLGNNHPKAENVSKTQNLSFCLTENTTPLYYKDMSIQTYSASVDSGLSISSLVEVGNLRPSHCIRTLARKCTYLSFLISIVINLYLLSTVVTFKLYVFSSNLGEGGSST